MLQVKIRPQKNLSQNLKFQNWPRLRKNPSFEQNIKFAKKQVKSELIKAVYGLAM